MKKPAVMTIVLPVLWVAFIGAHRSHGQVSCDSMYFLLQDLSVAHIRANEIWVDHFLDCPTASDTLGGFVLSELGQEGKKDRAVVARYTQRAGWQYSFGERAPNIRFHQPSPRMDINSDGELDFVFTATDLKYKTGRHFRIVLIKDGKQQNMPGLKPPKDMVIDSILPAPKGRPRPLRVVDRRGWDIGGLSPEKAPLSYRYLDWNNAADPPGYVNQTASYVGLFPVMLRRAAYFKTLPKSGVLQFDTAEEYEIFLYNVIGYCLDQNNLGQETDWFEEVSEILDRVRYAGSTETLDAPRQVRNHLRRTFPRPRGVVPGRK